MLDIEHIRQLIEMMVENDLTEVSLRDGEEEVNLRRPPPPHLREAACNVSIPGAQFAAPVAASPGAAPAAPVAPAADAPAKRMEEEELLTVTSPMVGTFYTSPSPDAPVFVQPGSLVTADTTVCIVEAMKVFNEIKAEVSGTIHKILAKNEQAVEFGQPLFLVRPD